MADTKISAMPAAIDVALADEFPIVKAGVNNKATKQQLLTGAAGQNQYLVAATLSHVGMHNFATTSYIRVYDNGNIDIFSAGAAGIQIFNNVNNAQCYIKGNGDIDLICLAAGKITRLGAPGVAGQIIIDNLAGQITINGAGIILIGYVPGVPANWILPAPGDVWTAIDRIAAAVVARTVGGPI